MNSNLSDIREKGLDILTKGLGAAGMAQFIQQFDNGRGNYTEERRNMFKDLSIDDIVSSIVERKKYSQKNEQ